MGNQQQARQPTNARLQDKAAMLCNNSLRNTFSSPSLKLYLFLVIALARAVAISRATAKPSLGSLRSAQQSKQCDWHVKQSRISYAPTLGLRGGGWFDGNTFALSDKELKAVERIRDELGSKLTDAAQQNPDLDTEDRLVRLLRVNDLHIGKTVVLFKKMMKWRSDVKADKIRAEILKCYSDKFWDMSCVPHKAKFRKFYFYEPFHCLDHQGDLLSIECTGAIHVRRFMRAVSEKDVMTFWTYIMEWNMLKLAQLSRKQGRLVSMAQIKDLQGLNFVQASSKAGMSRFRKVNRFMHECYPECLSSLTLINAPSIFGAIWRAFRPLLPARTIGKITVVAGDEHAQRKQLRRLLSASDPVCTNAGAVELYVPKGGTLADENGGKLFGMLKVGVLALGALCVRQVLGALLSKAEHKSGRAQKNKA